MVEDMANGVEWGLARGLLDTPLITSLLSRRSSSGDGAITVITNLGTEWPFTLDPLALPAPIVVAVAVAVGVVGVEAVVVAAVALVISGLSSPSGVSRVKRSLDVPGESFPARRPCL